MESFPVAWHAFRDPLLMAKEKKPGREEENNFFFAFDVAIFTPFIFLKQIVTIYRLISSSLELERILFQFFTTTVKPDLYYIYSCLSWNIAHWIKHSITLTVYFFSLLWEKQFLYLLEKLR